MLLSLSLCWLLLCNHLRKLLSHTTSAEMRLRETRFWEFWFGPLPSKPAQTICKLSSPYFGITIATVFVLFTSFVSSTLPVIIWFCISKFRPWYWWSCSKFSSLWSPQYCFRCCYYGNSYKSNDWFVVLARRCFSRTCVYLLSPTRISFLTK